ncbi:hypothetical protein ACJRO7_010377 [Eucalyptus globulus]|uniref:Uncharacterized protein n=1 Tax=Eucalyptus globulus TaxID=34317 RepID=A0ABD3LFF1_EUCGL
MAKDKAKAAAVVSVMVVHRGVMGPDGRRCGQVWRDLVRWLDSRWINSETGEATVASLGLEQRRKPRNKEVARARSSSLRWRTRGWQTQQSRLVTVQVGVAMSGYNGPAGESLRRCDGDEIERRWRQCSGANAAKQERLVAGGRGFWRDM